MCVDSEHYNCTEVTMWNFVYIYPRTYRHYRSLWAPPQIILQATTTARRTQHKSFLERVPILEQLTEYEILTIADALVENSYEDGHVVCAQGEVGDAFYIIKKVL